LDVDSGVSFPDDIPVTSVWGLGGLLITFSLSFSGGVAQETVVKTTQKSRTQSLWFGAANPKELKIRFINFSS
jgi:hypothetical protein